MAGSTVEQRIEHEQMQALARAVRRGRNQYEDDLDTLSDGIKNAGSRSHIANTLYDRLIPTLNKRSISNDFDSIIGKINYYT